MIFDGLDTPAIRIEMGAVPAATFVLNSSTLGGTAKLGYADLVWSELAAGEVLSVAIRRGRTRLDQNVDVGTITVVIDGTSGSCDPDNPDSPYWMGDRSLLARDLPLQVVARMQGVDTVLARGAIESVAVDQGASQTVTIIATDGLADLTSPTLASVAEGAFGDDTTSKRVARALSLANWQGTSSLQGSRAMLPTKLGTTPLVMCDEAAAVELGIFYADRLNVLQLKPFQPASTFRLTLSDDESADASYDAIKTSPGAEYLVNAARVDDGSGTVYVGSDQTSVQRYGVREVTLRAPVANAGDGQSLADALARRRSTPETRVESVTFSPLSIIDARAWGQLLACDLGDTVTVERTTPYGRALVWGCLVESIAHTITATSWQATFTLSPSPMRAGLFKVGSSTLGGTDTLWY